MSSSSPIARRSIWLVPTALLAAAALAAAMGQTAASALASPVAAPELVLQRGHDESIASVAWAPDGKTLASGGGGWNQGGEVKLWDVATGEVKRTLPGHAGPVGSLAFSPDGTTLMSAATWAEGPRADGEVKIWDVATGRLKRTLPGSHPIARVVMSPDWSLLARVRQEEYGIEGESSPTVTLWDARTGWLLHTLAVYHSVRLMFTADGKTIVTIDAAGARLWDVQTGRSKGALKGVNADSRPQCFSPDARMWASISKNKTVRLWDTATGRPLRALHGQTLGAGVVFFSPDAGTLISLGMEICRWDVATGALLRKIDFSVPAKALAATAAGFSPDSMVVAVAGLRWTDRERHTRERISEVQLWDTRTGELRRILRGRGNAAEWVAFAPDGKTLVTGWYDKAVRLWDARSGKLRRTLAGTPGEDAAVALAPDGVTLARGTGFEKRPGEAEITLWNSATGELLRTLHGQRSMSIDGLAFSSNGALLAATDGVRVYVWEALTGKLLHSFDGHGGLIFSVIFSPDSRLLADSSGDGTVKLWNTVDGRLLATLLATPTTRDGEISTGWLTYTPSGYYDGSAGASSLIRWRIGDRSFPAEQFESEFHRPEMVRQAFESR